MCFAVDFFPNPTPSSFFLSLWWWIESVLPNHWLDVTIMFVWECIISHKIFKLIRPSPSSAHPHHQNITCQRNPQKPPAGLRAGRTGRSPAANPVAPSSSQTPSKVCPSFSYVSFIAFLSFNFLDSRLDMGVVEQARERRDLEPTGPPDRTYKVPDHSHGKVPKGVYVINQILFLSMLCLCVFVHNYTCRHMLAYAWTSLCIVAHVCICLHMLVQYLHMIVYACMCLHMLVQELHMLAYACMCLQSLAHILHHD